MKGLVEKVIDGDSIKIREEGGSEVHEVQIEGTDAPEAKQEYGPESTEALRKLVLDRKVRITWTKKDNFGRRLAQVYIGDEHINRNMIRDGHSWHFKRYNQSKELAQAEEEAKKAKRGLWGTENPQAPWDYRKENRSPDKPDR
jgi:endonuclease YncB( thermonuclease family)